MSTVHPTHFEWDNTFILSGISSIYPAHFEWDKNFITARIFISEESLIPLRYYKEIFSTYYIVRNNF
jgi:hypothetical protein